MTQTTEMPGSGSTTGDFRGLRPDADPVGELFASRSVGVHYARGIVGLVLLVTGLALTSQSPWWLLLALSAGVAWRGCMSCWTIGLIATRARTCPRRG